MSPITFVTWMWDQPGQPPRFLPSYVNVLRAMIERNYNAPHRLVCVADDPSGLDPRIEFVRTPITYSQLRHPKGGRFPSCYRRLWNFSADAAIAFGPRIVSLDIDVVITGNLRPLFDRDDDLICWTDPRDTWANKVAGGLYLLRTGTHTHVYDRFDPARSPDEAKACGVSGSDQGWMSHVLYPPKASWTFRDGVYSSKWIDPGRDLPPGVRIVSTPGKLKPWHRELQRLHPWITRHWHE